MCRLSRVVVTDADASHGGAPAEADGASEATPPGYEMDEETGQHQFP